MTSPHLEDRHPPVDRRRVRGGTPGIASTRRALDANLLSRPRAAPNDPRPTTRATEGAARRSKMRTLPEISLSPNRRASLRTNRASRRETRIASQSTSDSQRPRAVCPEPSRPALPRLRQISKTIVVWLRYDHDRQPGGRSSVSVPRRAGALACGARGSSIRASGCGIQRAAGRARQGGGSRGRRVSRCGCRGVRVAAPSRVVDQAAVGVAGWLRAAGRG